MIVLLLPAKRRYNYPLDVDMCARWLLSNEPGKRGQSHLGVIRRVAELANVTFRGKRDYSSAEILEMIDEDSITIREDPRPDYPSRRNK